MRRIFMIMFFLLILCLVGFFVYLNSHNVAVRLFNNYSIHLNLWIVVLGAFLFGIVFWELRSLLFHPARLIQRLRLAAKNRWARKRSGWEERFQEALQRRDIKTSDRSLNKLSISGEVPLSMRVDRLLLKRYEVTSREILDGFAQLNREAPENMLVLVPYQQFALQQMEMSLVEFLSRQILALHHHHPDGMEGLRQVYMHRHDWFECVMVEIDLLKNHPHSALSERILMEHEIHLIKAMPEFAARNKDLPLKHLPSRKHFSQFHRVKLERFYAARMISQGQFLPAAKMLSQLFANTGAFVVLDDLESCYFLSGKNQGVLRLLKGLQQSDSNNQMLKLTLARLHLRSGDIQQAEETLDQLSNQDSALPQSYAVLRYLLSEYKNDVNAKMLWVQTLLPKKDLWDSLYQYDDDLNPAFIEQMQPKAKRLPALTKTA